MDRERLLRHATNGEDRMLLSKLADRAVKAEQVSYACWSAFLDPRQQMMVEQAFSGAMQDSSTTLRFDGGYEGAERSLAGFIPETEWESDDEAPLRLLLVRRRAKGDVLSHRDYLGALMGLGVKRETIGDILVSEEGAQLIVLADLSEFIRGQLEKVGAERVQVSEASWDALVEPERKERMIHGTVMSLRLDAIASTAFSTSRTRMADWIRAEKVTLNWEVQSNPAKSVKSGDVISIRGKGRAEMESVGGISRKGRTGILVRRFV